MEEYLRRVQSRLRADVSEGPVHAVLGGPEPDVDTVAATLCLALHLSQKEPSGGVCVPVLCGRRGDAVLPEETTKYLQSVKISRSSLLWEEDVDLVKLHLTGKLSITLLRDGLLESSEYHTVESSILRVVHHDGQRDAGDDGVLSAAATVAREILQEAAEHIRATLGEILGEALRLQQEAVWIKTGCQSAQLEELMASLEQWSTQQTEDTMQRLAVELKEFSDGEMTIALTSLTTDKENWPGFEDGLKTFSQHRGYEGLVVLMSISDLVHHPRQQVAVYSNNTDMLNQICSELEESSSWSLSGELEGRGSLQVYHIPINTSASSGTPPLLEKEIQEILKDFVDRRGSVLACHPSSRTSSTEGVAGSVEFSQGSSGINDMDGSDIERTEGGNGDVVPIARVMAEGEEDPGGAGVSGGGELVSPDSGMTTIRSSRSSKESSVFLSDDSPVGEIMAAAGPGGLFLRNPSPLGLLSLSPPIPPERRKHHSSRNKSDNLDLFSFDPLHGSDQLMRAGGELVNPGERGDEDERRAGSSSLSEIDELSLLDFSAPYSLGGIESANSSIDRHGHIHGSEMIDTVVPPTPVNSLVGSRPPSSCGVRFFPEDVIERINGLQHKDSMSSSLSETWDELGFETHGGLLPGDGHTWNRLKDSESPQNVIEEVEDKDAVGDMMESASTEKISKPEDTQPRGKCLEPQLSLITEQTEVHDNWNTEALLENQWNPVSLADLQLTPPEWEDETRGRCKVGVNGAKDRTSSLSVKKPSLNTLTPDTSKEDDEGVQGRKKPVELLDFWTYSAQKGFLKSESGTTASYPESLDMWNMTIRDDSLSPLTTPDNLSEKSGSFSGLHPNLKSSTSLESPLGYSDGGMQMWNTTIQEDSSSTITSPEGPDNGKDLSHMGSLDASDTLESPVTQQVDDKAATEDSSQVTNQTNEVDGLLVNTSNVKIVIEAAEGGDGEEVGDEDVQSFQSQQFVSQNKSKPSDDETSTSQGADMWDLSVHGMVTSTSEYDNVGAGTWSLSSSPDTYSSPVVDMIQLEGQSSPFIAVTKPFHIEESHSQSQKADALRKTEGRGEVSDEGQSTNQVFLFEETSESNIRNRSRVVSEADPLDQAGDHSPFLLVDYSTVSQRLSQTPEKVPETQILAKQSMSSARNKHGGPGSTSSSRDMTIKDALNVDAPGIACQESSGNVEGKIAEALSLSSSPGAERDTPNSPDSLLAGGQDKHGSSSDGDSFSGLEMEYIIVSGTVKEAKSERYERPKQRGTKKSMETFSMLSYAASILQTQAQAASRTQQENKGQSSQTRSESADNAANRPVVPESISASQSKNSSQAFHQPDSKTQLEEEHCDSESNTVARSVSPSLRYPSDHFLKTREEVYVHSQISMEDSDEGGQSPSAHPQCPTSLGDFQSWGDQLVRQDTSQTTSEPQSPALTNSSISHTSSSVGTPLGDSCVSAEKGLGLPFSGDLMEEENEEEEQEEEIEHSSLPEWTSDVQRNERQQIDLLSFTEDLIGSSSFQQTDLQTIEPKRDGFRQSRVDYYHGQATRTDTHDKWSIEVQTGDHESPLDGYSPGLRRGQDVTSQLPSQPTSENAAYQWTPSLDTAQGQTQYGYNYHHIDQRTENQCSYSACSDAKSSRQANTTDVYAEFTTAATNVHYRSESRENYYEAGDNAQYNLDDAGFKCQYVPESQYAADSASLHAPELQYAQYQADDTSQYEPDRSHYEFDGQSFYHSEAQPETEDHARYVPEGYVHFLLTRNSQQGAGAAGMVVKTASSEEAEDELDNREDPPSSTDVSGGSNQRRKLVAPPMNVSLDRSEGSLLSDDALDTEDDALDTGDDLDVNIDELDTPDEADSLDLNRHGSSEESNVGAAAAAASDPITGQGAAEVSRDGRLWRSVVIGEQEHRIDMKCIEPYKRVISHGGYYAEQNAIIVFAACFLPDSDCNNYNYVMENLFLYVISTLELMVADDYMIVYLNGATPRRRMPGFTWMKRCYQMIDRRLKKNLKMFIIVHPSWFIRTLLGITRPFISSKFSSKIKYVSSLRELGEIIPMEYVHIPPSILKYDEERAIHKFACARLDTDLQDTADKVDQGNSAV